MISGDRYHLDAMWLERLLFYEEVLDIFDSVSWFKLIPLVSVAVVLSELGNLLIVNFSKILESTIGKVLAKPKSQILTLQSLSIKILAGFISLWMTLAECKNLRPHRRLYIITIICSSDNSN